MKIITKGMEMYTSSATIVLGSSPAEDLTLEYTDEYGKQQSVRAVVRSGRLRIEYKQGEVPFTQN